jgi:WD40 repeat protein
VHAVTAFGQHGLACSSLYHAVWIWDPATGEHLATLEGHEDSVTAVCAVTAHDRELLASASRDRTVRIWDPTAGGCVLTLPTHHGALAVVQIDDALVVGLDAGILVIKPSLLS